MSKLAGSLLILGSLTLSHARASERWIHVRVDDTSDKSHVDVQVPLNLVSTMLPTLSGRHGKHAIEIDGNDVDIAKIRECWKALRDAKDGEYVTVKDADSEVRVSKSGGVFSLIADDQGGRSRVRMKVPVPLVDAVLSSGTDTLDLEALSGALGDVPSGDLITVDDEDSHVRIWVDSAAAPAKEDHR